MSAVAGWTTTITDMVGVETPLTNHPLQAYVTEPVKPILNKIIVSAGLHVYVSQTDRGEFLIGAEIEPYTTYSTRSTWTFVEQASANALELFPFLARQKIHRQWTGYCDMTPDYSPVMGLTGVDGFLLDSGWGTWGFKASPICGVTMAQLIATGQGARADRAVLARPLLDRHDGAGEGRGGGLPLMPVALVTGGGTGIGRATAHALSRAGYRIAVAGRRRELLEETIAELGDGLVLVGDHADEGNAARFVSPRPSSGSAASTSSSTTPARSGATCRCTRSTSSASTIRCGSTCADPSWSSQRRAALDDRGAAVDRALDRERRLDARGARVPRRRRPTARPRPA